MTGTRVRRQEDPSRCISQVLHRNLYLAAGQVLKSTEGCLLEQLAQEEAKGSMLDDMCVNLEQHIAYLQG